MSNNKGSYIYWPFYRNAKLHNGERKIDTVFFLSPTHKVNPADAVLLVFAPRPSQLFHHPMPGRRRFRHRRLLRKQATDRAFVLAFQDVFRLGAALVALDACVFFFSPAGGQWAPKVRPITAAGRLVTSGRQ